MAQAAIAKAVLDHPDKFAVAAKTAVETLGVLIDDVGKALDVLASARSHIASTTTDHTTIVNLSAVEHTWYTYNDIAPLRSPLRSRVTWVLTVLLQFIVQVGELWRHLKTTSIRNIRCKEVRCGYSMVKIFIFSIHS